MSQTLLAWPNDAVTEAGCCPTCQDRLTAKRVCWRCCDRLCPCCGGQTGSAFIEVCWLCWFRSEQTGSAERGAP